MLGSLIRLQICTHYMLRGLFFSDLQIYPENTSESLLVCVCSSLVPREITATAKCAACREFFEGAHRTWQGSLPWPLCLVRVLAGKLI